MSKRNSNMQLFSRAMYIAMTREVRVNQCPVWGHLGRSTKARWLRYMFAAGFYVSTGPHWFTMHLPSGQSSGIDQLTIDRCAGSSYKMLALAVRASMQESCRLSTSPPWNLVSRATRARWMGLLRAAGFTTIGGRGSVRLLVNPQFIITKDAS